jgi:hypothetical protein
MTLSSTKIIAIIVVLLMNYSDNKRYMMIGPAIANEVL